MVTEGHYARLDPVQEMVVREVGDRKVSNVFIWGSSGSGKTIVATQVLDIILAQYRAINKQYKATVTSYTIYHTELGEGPIKKTYEILDIGPNWVYPTYLVP